MLFAKRATQRRRASATSDRSWIEGEGARVCTQRNGRGSTHRSTNEKAPAFRPGHVLSKWKVGRSRLERRRSFERADARVDYRACAAAVVCVGASESFRTIPTFTRDMSSPMAALFSS